MYALRCKLTHRPTHSVWDLVSGLLYQFHSQGIEEGEEPPPTGEAALVAANEFEHALEPGVLLPPEQFSAYFDNLRDVERAHRAIEEHLRPFDPMFTMEEVAHQNYDELWKENFHPISVDPCWLIRASWHQVKLNPGQIELLIEPGMAFGTGSHETTKACLELMAQACAQTKNLNKKTLLDFGCGSGILAIGLKKLGASRVIGVDIDPLSLDASRQNAKYNNVEIEVSLGVPFETDSMDGIVANILKNTLLEFSTSFSKWLKPGGFLILSGLLSEQEETILDAYRALGFELKNRIENNNWVSLWLSKKA